MVMDLTFVADAVTAIASEQGLGFGLANSPLPRQNFLSISNLALSDYPAADPLASVLQTSAMIVDAMAPPPVKPNKHRTARRTLIRKRRRTKRGSSTGGDSDDFGVFGGDNGGGGEGPFGFGGGGGSWGSGGGGWDFGMFGEQNWDESSSSSSWWSTCSFAYGFVYEVVYWIALSNCVHFAFKKVARIMAAGMGDGEQQKVHRMALTPVC